MEYTNMGNLNTWLAQQPNHRVSEQVALQLLQQIAKALYCLRSLKVAHRFLSSANLLLFPSDSDVPKIKITGFDLACEAQEGQMLQSVVGSPPYMVGHTHTDSHS
jgi:serine/threonine protein kinase